MQCRQDSQKLESNTNKLRIQTKDLPRFSEALKVLPSGKAAETKMRLTNTLPVGSLSAEILTCSSFARLRSAQE